MRWGFWQSLQGLVVTGLAVVSLVLGATAGESHWAFHPVTPPEVPAVDDSWAATAIDSFVWKKLHAQGLSPSARADDRALVRRAVFALTGLPPDESLQEKELDHVIDACLASPAYGERWGRHWLDVARYSDAKGYVDAGEVRYPFSYTYRDYVVGAFNEDLPFDRFALEQIAADRLGRAEDDSSLAGLGFLTIGSRFNFFPHEIIDDRIDAVSRGFLGLSVACARCHDHKFDPVTTEDYYSLYSIFANTKEPHLGEAPLLEDPGPHEDAAFHEKLCQAVYEYETWRAAMHEQIKREMCGWAGDYLRYVVQSMPEHRTAAQPALRTERGLIREVSAYSGGGVIRWREFLQARRPEDPVFGLWARLVALKRDEIINRAASVLKQWQDTTAVNPLVVEAFTGARIASMADVADRYGRVLEDVDARWRDAGGEDLKPADEEVRQAMYAPGGPGDIGLEESEDFYTLNESVQARQLFAAIERVFLDAGDELAPRPMAVADRDEPVENRVFIRGDARQPGKPVSRAVPDLLQPYAENVDQGSGRRELAEMIAHPDNPLTSRVIVNRVWAWHFGRGLVNTPSDFGTQGEKPSHPELLDYLAWWFCENDWSIKKLHRLILASSTWQQASVDRPDCREVDPENRYLWKMNRRRLSFEGMRDSLLHAAGHLDRRLGGPPVQQRPDAIENRRRTLYTYVDREKLAEVFRMFDFPSPDITAPQRWQTSVPQQSLFLLNSPFVLAQAEGVVRRVECERDKLKALYRRILGREPDMEETRLAREYLSGAGQGEALQLRWMELAQALLLCNEFQFVD